MEPCKMLWGWTARRGDLDAYRLVCVQADILSVTLTCTRSMYVSMQESCPFHAVKSNFHTSSLKVEPQTSLPPVQWGWYCFQLCLFGRLSTRTITLELLEISSQNFQGIHHPMVEGVEKFKNGYIWLYGCLRFGLWLTLCTLNIYLLIYYLLIYTGARVVILLLWCSTVIVVFSHLFLFSTSLRRYCDQAYLLVCSLVCSFVRSVHL